MLKELLEEKLKEVEPEKPQEIKDSIGEYYPSLYLNSDTLPEIKDWDVGEEYYLVMKVEQKSKSANINEKEERWAADFDIKEIGVLEMNEKSLKDKYSV